MQCEFLGSVDPSQVPGKNMVASITRPRSDGTECLAPHLLGVGIVTRCVTVTQLLHSGLLPGNPVGHYSLPGQQVVNY